MMRTRFIAAFALLVALAHATLTQELDTRPAVAALAAGEGFVLFAPKIISTRGDEEAAVSAQTPRLAAQLFADDGGVIHRLLVDERGDLVFGYDLSVEAMPEAGSFRVSARPLDSELESRLRARTTAKSERGAASRASAQVSTLARATPARIVTEADTFALDLLVNETAEIKIVDHVRIARTRERLYSPRRPAPPRDFSLTDVDLALRDFRLVIDGEEVRAASAKRSCRGSLVYLHLPGRGRFIFSLAPHDGYDFVKTATIENDRIVFEWKGQRYEWVSREPVVAGGGAWRLWMLHDDAADDLFEIMPPEPEARRPSPTERAFSDPLAVIAERTTRSGFGDATPRRSGASVRVRIGGTNDIETIVPRKPPMPPR